MMLFRGRRRPSRTEDHGAIGRAGTPATGSPVRKHIERLSQDLSDRAERCGALARDLEAVDPARKSPASIRKEFLALARSEEGPGPRLKDLADLPHWADRGTSRRYAETRPTLSLGFHLRARLASRSAKPEAGGLQYFLGQSERELSTMCESLRRLNERA